MLKNSDTWDSVRDRMAAVDASVLAEDNMLFRACEHGVKHPVGHLSRNLTKGFMGHTGDEVRHHSQGDSGGPVAAKCCGCCEGWPGSLSA